MTKCSDLKFSSTKLKINFFKKETQSMCTLAHRKAQDDGLKASYISLMIAKAGKAHTIGKELILPAIKEVLKQSYIKIP